jgi:hypothetical protein
MESEWYTAFECKANWSETLYIFRHCKGEEPDRYYSVWFGDGDVTAEQLTKEQFFNKFKRQGE